MASSSKRQRSGLKGVNRLRRTLRRADPEIRQNVADVVEDVTMRVLGAAQQLVPVDEGSLRAALRAKVARDGLTARVGLLTKKQQRDYFYARFILYGTKGGKGQPPRRATPFLFDAVDLYRDDYRRAIDDAIDQALARIVASSGGIEE